MEEEKLGYDIGPDEDDDDFFDDPEEEKYIQELENKNSMQTNPFATSQPQPQTPYSPWTPGTNNIWGTSAPKPQYSTPYTPPAFGTAWQGTGGYSSGITTGAVGTGKKSLDRTKSIIFCDLLDNLIEPFGAQGRSGVQPRGIFDLRLKFEVWDKLSALGPKYVFALTNQNIEPSSIGAKVFTTMSDYVMFSLAEYIRVPYQNCRCFMKFGYDQSDPYVKPGTGLIKLAMEQTFGPGWKQQWSKSDMLVLGACSGLAGQNGRDAEMAKRAGLDYIDIQQLLSLYY